VTGIQAGKCVTNKADNTSTQRFSAQCGSGNVDGSIDLTGLGTWSFTVDLHSTGACNLSGLFQEVPDPNKPNTLIFAKNEIFATTVSFNNPKCSGLGNDGPANFRSCTGSTLDTDPSCKNNNPDHPLLATVGGGLAQINTFDLSCQRLPAN